MNIKVVESVSNYEEAIKISCDMLEKSGAVENRYFDAIKEKIKEYGPYFCIADGICMPHARPEDGALKNEVCILKLNNPVDFQGKSINVFFTLSATNGDSHMDLLKKVADICMNKDKLNIIKKANNKEEIMEVF